MITYAEPPIPGKTMTRYNVIVSCDSEAVAKQIDTLFGLLRIHRFMIGWAVSVECAAYAPDTAADYVQSHIDNHKDGTLAQHIAINLVTSL